MVLEILKFVFSSFWTWAGTVIMLGIVTEGISRAFQALIYAVQNR